MKREDKQTLLSWLLMVAVLVVLFIISSFTSCGTSKSSYIYDDKTMMEYVMDTVVDRHFIDSVCVSDTLGTYPDGWIYSPMRGYDSRKDISIYSWMKPSNWTLYRVIEEDGKYRITKRITK